MILELVYQRGPFVVRLPRLHRYTLHHQWIARAPGTAGTPGAWRVGFTRFGLRLLGQLIEVRWDLEPGHATSPGRRVGTLEGFKAVTDLHPPAAGRFLGPNPALEEGLEPLERTPSEFWLYALAPDGPLPDGLLDADEYARILDATLGRFLECRLDLRPEEEGPGEGPEDPAPSPPPPSSPTPEPPPDSGLRSSP